MSNRLWWIPTVYTLSAAIMISCAIMGVLMTRKALQPYYDMMDAPAKLWSGELRYFHTGEKSSKIYSYSRQATTDINHREYANALENIEKAQSLDPDNAVFYYIKAFVCYKTDRFTQMWRFIEAGNNAGGMRIHSSRDIPVQAWVHPEISMLRQMAVTMARSISSVDELWELVRMGDRVIHAEPCEVDLLYVGLGIRELAAKRISEYAKLDNNTRLYDLCRDLIRERYELSQKYAETPASDSYKQIGIPTMLMAMSGYRKNPNVRTAYWIMIAQKQAEAAEELRQKSILIPVGKKPQDSY